MRINIDDEKYCSEYYFLDNRKHYSRLLYVLAGYKPILWENVFRRIKEFTPKNVDVCIISSGIYSDRLESICKDNNWSYLSTEQNKLTIAQNIAISLFENAEIIFKMDEDVFLTEDFWSLLEETYKKNEMQYRVGFVGPLMPLHNYGVYRYFEIKQLNEKWREYAPHFSKCLIGGHNRDENPMLYSDDIADFLWDQCQQIDSEARAIRRMNLPDEKVAMRFPICAVMFNRRLWKKIGGFEVGSGNGGGYDELQMVKFCAENSYFIICDLRSVCYHFGFAYQEHILYRKYRVFKKKFVINREN